MTLNEFIEVFAEEFENTEMSVFKADTEFKDLEEWDSLTALSIIAMVDKQFNKTITGANLRTHNTIEDLYNFIVS